MSLKYTEKHGKCRNAGVYKITLGNDFYIGSSMDLQKRANQHYYAMKNGKSSIKLNEAWSKYKEFDFDVIEYVDGTKPKWYLRSREQYWITQLHPTLNESGVTDAKNEEEAQQRKYAMLPIMQHRTNKKSDYSSTFEKPYGKFEYYNFQEDDVIHIIRSKVICGEYWFVAGDIAHVLGYSEMSPALKKHVKPEDIYPDLIRTDNGQFARFINENGVISFCTSSKKKIAYNVKEWFVTDVLSKIDSERQ